MSQQKFEISFTNNTCQYAFTDRDIDIVNQARNERDGLGYVISDETITGIIKRDTHIIIELPAISNNQVSPISVSLEAQMKHLNKIIENSVQEEPLAYPIKILAPYKLDAWHWNVLEIEIKKDPFQIECRRYDTDGKSKPVEPNVFKDIQTAFQQMREEDEFQKLAFLKAHITNQQDEKPEYEQGIQRGINCGLGAGAIMHDLKSANKKRDYDGLDVILNKEEHSDGNAQDRKLRQEVNSIVGQYHPYPAYAQNFCKPIDESQFIDKLSKANFLTKEGEEVIKVLQSLDIDEDDKKAIKEVLQKENNQKELGDLKALLKGKNTPLYDAIFHENATFKDRNATEFFFNSKMQYNQSEITMSDDELFNATNSLLEAIITQRENENQKALKEFAEALENSINDQQSKKEFSKIAKDIILQNYQNKEFKGKKSEKLQLGAKENKKDLETTSLSSVQTKNEAKHTLIYTKFERNTGGDQQLLNMVSNRLIENLDKNGTIDLFLAYDTASEKRANDTAKEWQRKYQDKKITVWGHKSEQAGTRLKPNIKGPITYLGNGGEKPIIDEGELNTINEGVLFYDYIKGKNPDLIVVGGWSHLLDGKDAEHLSDKFLQSGASGKKKVLLCSPPGTYVNYNGFKEKLEPECTKKGYALHCFQPGVYTKAGLPIPTKLSTEGIRQADCRAKWVEHLQNLSEEDFGKLSKNSNPEAKQDNLVVIYCSKDGPGFSKGKDFLKKAAKEIGELQENLKDYSVLLVGADTLSKGFNEWEKTCKDAGFESVVPVERTKSSDVLMRGLRDAKFSMATGSFTILEAKALGINHCEYLCPPHLTDFGKLLDEASPKEMEAAFKRGKQSLEDLGQLKLNQTTLASDTALKNYAEETAMKPDEQEQKYRKKAEDHQKCAKENAVDQQISRCHQNKAKICEDIADLYNNHKLLKQQASGKNIAISECDRKRDGFLKEKENKDNQIKKSNTELESILEESNVAKEAVTAIALKIESLKDGDRRPLEVEFGTKKNKLQQLTKRIKVTSESITKFEKRLNEIEREIQKIDKNKSDLISKSNDLNEKIREQNKEIEQLISTYDDTSFQNEADQKNTTLNYREKVKELREKKPEDTLDENNDNTEGNSPKT